MIHRNVEAEALGTHGEVVNRDVAINSHALTCLDLHEIFRRNIRQHNLHPMPFISDVLRRPPEGRRDVLLLLHLHHGDVEAARVHPELMDEQSRHASVLVRRAGVGVTRRRRIEHHRVHDGIAGKASFRRVLIHIYKHVETRLVRVLVRVVELGSRFLRWRWADVSRPFHDCPTGILPPAPAVLEVTSPAERNFV